MKQQIVYITIVLMGLTSKACIPSGAERIEKINTPDNEKIKTFFIKYNGKIVYQFYEKYGFTDMEEHLIMIVKSDDVDFLTSNLPFDSVDIKRFQKIDLQKFIKGEPVNFELEKTFQEDIRLESKEFDSRQEKSIFYGKGKYKIILNDSIETVYVFDKKSGLLYVESKMMK